MLLSNTSSYKATEHQHLLSHRSAGDGVVPEAANPEEMSPAIIAVYCPTPLKTLPVPAAQQFDEYAPDLQTSHQQHLMAQREKAKCQRGHT